MRYTVTYYYISCFLIAEDYSSPSILLLMATKYVASTGPTSSLPFLMSLRNIISDLNGSQLATTV